VTRTHPLAFPIRLPDALQEEALRLLDASRAAINQLLVGLWPDLDRFAAERTGPAWKQVEQYAIRRSGHGSRQERCEMEQAGRILRAQASRKQVFQTILPLLSAGLIRPAEGKRPAKKDYRLIREQVRALRAEQQEAGEEADAFMALTNLIEQACNFYLETGAFPATYEEVQPVPVQAVGQLPFAGDDGMHAGQTYRALRSLTHSCDLSTRAEVRQASLWLRLRAPDPQGTWTWGAWSAQIPLPAAVFAYLEQGATRLSPTLREIVRPDGSRVAVLDLILEVPTRRVPPLASERRVLGFDWGVRSLITASVVEKRPGKRYPQVSRPVFLDTGGIDGRQARLRREIDRLKACRAHYEALCAQALSAHAGQQTPLPTDFPRWQGKVRAYEERIGACWQKYARRNRELAHLAANLLILLALLADCRLICGENLATLRDLGARTWGAGALAHLAQQHHRARGALARAQLQVPPAGDPRQTGGAAWDHPHLPALPSAGPHLCLLGPRRPQAGARLGTLALL
jgi:putative transposase